MAMTERENYLRAATFHGPEYIPVSIHISNASWLQLRGDLEDVLVRHPRLFPDFRKGTRDYDALELDYRERKGTPLRDAWGCVWENALDGIVGQVLTHPLESWEAFETFQPPDPLATDDQNPLPNWQQRQRAIESAKRAGRVARGSLPHGFLFLRLSYLRGFENFMCDVAAGEPRLYRLIDIVREHNLVKVRRWVELQPDVMHFPDDLGSQNASLISPEQFRRYLLPAYRSLMDLCTQRGILVHFHSDGHIVELADLLYEAGVNIVNPQDLCNGIDEIKRTMKGRFCIDLDVDRQKIVPFGSRREIYDLIEMEVRELGSDAGGLMFTVGIYPPTPPENIDALLCAFEKYCFGQD